MVIVFCYFMQNFIDLMSKRLVFPLVMNMYTIFDSLSIIEVEVASAKIEAVL